MDKHALDILEFKNILTSLKHYCFTEEAQELINNQKIITNKDDLNYLFDIGSAIKSILESGENLPIMEFFPIKEACERISLEGIVGESSELFNIAKYLSSTKSLKNFFLKYSEDEVLKNELDLIPEIDGLVKTILSKINNEGNIKEDLPELRSLRSDIGKINGKIKRICNKYFSDSNLSSYWQDRTPSERDGRTVLALKANFKGKVKGIVHEVSRTGSTIFIEPLDVVEINNDLVEKQNEYKYLVYKILRELTELVRENLPEIFYCIEKFSFIDSIYARCRYSIVNNCIRPDILDRGLNIKEARHPMLGKSAVPINILLNAEYNLLVVSGPNTGGKTVCLKTAGLFAAMHQFAMEIPAEEGSCLCLFDNIFADIGDEQSISNSLSTFSGHMARIAEILEKSTNESLVLLDELGSGTDPQDGSALAMAILDRLIEKNAMVITTTHNSIIKNFALMNEKVENASVDFDKKTFSPKYRIIQGVPGESHGLEIASKNGITEDIVKNAYDYSNKNEDISIIIERLNKKERELAFSEKKLAEKENNLNFKIKETDLFHLKIKQKELELKKFGLSDLNNHLNESRKTVENLVCELKEGELSKAKILKAKEALKEIENKSENLQKDISKSENETYISPDFEIKENMNVLVGQFKRSGITVRKEKSKKWLVNVNSVKMLVPENDIFEDPSEKTEKTSVEYSRAAVLGSNRPEFELKLLGFRLNEAIELVEKQIDRAILSGMYEFSIVHGKGSGILQEGIQAYLRKNRNVQDYHFASPEFGGFGKTMVSLKK